MLRWIGPSVTKVLDDIIKSDPPFHVLIDTGALITGISNYGVARYMLTHGLSTDFDGVVFLDHRDRKMIVSVVQLVYGFALFCFSFMFCCWSCCRHAAVSLPPGRFPRRLPSRVTTPMGSVGRELRGYRSRV